MIKQGFSSFLITPDTDYNSYISKDISKKAWQITGNRLKEAMVKIGGKY